MTIRVRLKLNRQARSELTSALYIASQAPAELFAICAAINLDPSGRVFAVAGGFLVVLAEPIAGGVAGTVRLKELCPGLYLAADGELVPALLADEAAGMVRDRGLIFLPDGRVLEFDRTAAIELSELIDARPRSRRVWSPMPAPEGPAERLVQIGLELPEPDPESIYREIRNEMNRPRPQSGPEQADRGPGRGTANLPDASQEQDQNREHDDDTAGRAVRGSQGSAGGSPGGLMHGAGAIGSAFLGIFSPMGRAISAMREKIQWDWVDHSALLSKLVREFREGDPAQALKRAIPIGRPPAEGQAPLIPARMTGLPWMKAIYNLSDLLRRPGRGEPIPVLVARDQVIRQLMEEYRKAAEQALKNGDFRRAAYIYGVLLQDDRTAANALLRAGLHRDAAIIFLNKLKDKSAAARAFEAGGEFDRALELYRLLGEHEPAGDLLRRIGEEEAAVAEYVLAAEMLSSKWANHLNAGRLLLEKARRVDLATEQFQTGWSERPARNSIQCGVALALLHADKGDIDGFRRLLDEADAMFDAPGYPFDGHFYNQFVRIAEVPTLEAIALEVRDRALLATARALARGLESRQTAGAMVSKWLGKSELWPAALVSDAEFAVAAAAPPPRRQLSLARKRTETHCLQVGRGAVTAVCQALVSGEILLGFEQGLICVLDPEREQVTELPKAYGTVVALSVDPQGRAIAALVEHHGGVMLCFYTKRPDGSYLSRVGISITAGAQSWLTPILEKGAERLVGVCEDVWLNVFDVASGLPRQHLRIADLEGKLPTAGFLLDPGPGNARSASALTVLTHDQAEWVLVEPMDESFNSSGCKWLPLQTGAHSLRCAPLSWRHSPPSLALVGVDREGAVRAAEFYLERHMPQLIGSRVASTDAGYVGAAHAGSNTVVAASPAGVDWLSVRGDRFRLAHKAEIGLPTAVAVFATHRRDALVVCSRGLVMRIAPPRRGAAP